MDTSLQDSLQPARWTFLSLGALIHRLDPGAVPFRKATSCAIHVSGGEFNTAANLADCFGLRTGIATAMVDYPIGDLIAGRVRAMGVTPFYKMFKHDGAWGPNMAAVYSDRGHGVRGAGRLLQPQQRSGGAAQAGRLRLGDNLRSGASAGFTAAASSRRSPRRPRSSSSRRCRRPGKHGAVVSFDLNYREKLWGASGGHQRAVSVLGRIVEHVDVLVGNEEDLQKGLGIPGPEVASKSKLDPDRVLRHDRTRGVAKYPQIKVVATTLREVHSTSRHSWGAVAWIDGDTFVAPTCDLDVYDRVGGGDGFASGLIYGLLTGETPDESVRLGWAHGALIATFPGDTTMATVDQVRAFAKGGSARIQR